MFSKITRFPRVCALITSCYEPSKSKCNLNHFKFQQETQFFCNRNLYCMEERCKQNFVMWFFQVFLSSFKREIIPFCMICPRYSDRKFSRAETGDSFLYCSMMEIFLKEHHHPCAAIQCSPGSGMIYHLFSSEEIINPVRTVPYEPLQLTG